MDTGLGRLTLVTFLTWAKETLIQALQKPKEMKVCVLTNRIVYRATRGTTGASEVLVSQRKVCADAEVCLEVTKS